MLGEDSRPRGPHIEEHIVGNYKIEFPVAVVVDKGATRTPRGAATCDSGRGGDFLEGAIAFIVVQTVLTVVGDEKVVEAVIVVVADAHALSPAGEFQSRCLGDVGEGSVMVVVVQVASWLGTSLLRLVHGRAVHEKYVGPAVVVVIKNGYATTCGFDNELLGVGSSVYVFHVESGLLGHVN